MALTVTWILFPVVLAALCVGCGLLLERLAGLRLPGALVPAVGFATIVVVGQVPTLWDATAELTTPVTVALAVAGFALSFPWRGRRVEPWAVAASGCVLAVYAAPIVLSGQATFAGFIRLDDTATWMALTDRVMEHGRSLGGLAPSTYEATLAFNLGSGYPVGVFLPLGIGRQLVGQDVAWVIQPYMAFAAALLALGLWDVVAPLVRPRALRALVVFLAAQSALLLGYYLWGGIKEIVAAALIATVAGLAAYAIRERFAGRALLPLSVTSAALIGVLSGGGAIWLAPILVATLVAAFRALGPSAALGRATGFAVVTGLLCLPVLIPGGGLPPTSSPLTSATALGNLFHPLDKLQVLGIWPAGDFRGTPADATAAYVLIAVVAAVALAGLYAAWRARAWSLLIYVVGALAACVVFVGIGSPWVGGKAMATASPAIPAAAAAGAAALYASGRRVPGGLLLAAIAAGILWSNALAYRDVNLAPRAQLAELETIGHRIAGQGPTLMTEYEPYGARHFLRDAAPEGASELRRRRVPLRGGGTLHKGQSADTDRFQLGGLMAYRTLVLRRSPVQSRPPSPYRLIWKGDYYEAWQRPVGALGTVISHLGLGTAVNPSAVPRCDDVRRLAQLAREAGPTGRLAAVARAPVEAISLKRTDHPQAWDVPGYPRALLPTTPGTIQATVRVGHPGEYGIWLGGSVRPQVDLLVDGRPVGEVREQLNNDGEYVLLGRTRLAPGRHEVTIRFEGADLHPGSGGTPSPIGPLILSPEDASGTNISYTRPSQASRLCGKRWDWIEATAGRG